CGVTTADLPWPEAGRDSHQGLQQVEGGSGLATPKLTCSLLVHRLILVRSSQATKPSLAGIAPHASGPEPTTANVQVPSGSIQSNARSVDGKCARNCRLEGLWSGAAVAVLGRCGVPSVRSGG